ncbi:MAG: hypothetical protein GKR99_06160 [Rhodobacteraceae bacterium]|nr:hypothetical protein [Paracoccaceae bacterium]
MVKKSGSLMDWLGFRDPPDWMAAPWFGRMLGRFVLLLMGLVAIGALASLWQFLAVAFHYEAGTSGEAIRNIGLVLAAAFGAPFIAWRSYVAQRQANIAEQGLTTDRINKAVEGLGREKTVRRHRKNNKGTLLYEDGPDGKPDYKKPIIEELTEPNIEVRIGAIYALERVARESLKDHIQIMEILCAYIRANAPTDGLDSAPPHDAADPDQWKKDLDKWTKALPTTRDDIQAALEVIGRRDPEQIAMERAATGPGRDKGYVLDLRNTNLRRCDITQLNVDRARLENVHLEEAGLDGAHLEGVSLDGAHLSSATSLKAATLRGAALRDVDCSKCATVDSLVEAYGDASVKLPDGLTAGEGKLAHWSTDELDWDDFDTQRRAYQKSIGYTPPESES